MRLASLIVITLLQLGLVGCTVRAYSGAALPADQVSTVTLHTMGEVELYQVAFDGNNVSSFYNNFEVAQGNHEIRLNFSIEDRTHCYSGDRYCFINTVSGQCEGTLNTKPGNKYLVPVENKNSYVTSRLTAKGYYDFSERADEPNPGVMSCQTNSPY